MIHLSFIAGEANKKLHKLGQPPLSYRELALTETLLESLNKQERRIQPPAVIPTEMEVEQLSVQMNLPVSEGRRFYDYYESNGWKVGKNPMKNWRSALRNWKRTYDDRNSSKGLGYAV